jgi:Flp pilus assembly protein TadD
MVCKHAYHGRVKTTPWSLSIALPGVLLVAAFLPQVCRAQQGATEVDQPRPARPAASRPVRNAPRRDISAELSAAQTYIDAEDWPKAAVELARARAKDPANADVINLLGFCQRRGGDLKAALVSFQDALRLQPQHRSAHEQIGKTYLLLGDPEAAQRHLASLQKLCGDSCSESRELDTAIRAYLR